MSAKTHLKLGLFTLLAASAAVVTAFTFGMRSVGGEKLEYHAYFDESVQGLDVGSPVKFRGVAIGKVAAIGIATDRRHVDVTVAIDARDMRRLGLLAKADGAAPRLDVAPELRVELGTQGITGVKFVDLDFFDPATSPPPALPFEPAPNYLPTAASFFGELGDRALDTVRALPELSRELTGTVKKLQQILDDFSAAALPRRVAEVLDDVGAAIGELRVTLRQLERADLPARVAATLAALDGAVASIERVVSRFGADGGLLASAERATDAVGDVGRGAAGTAAELGRTLRALAEAAQAVRDLAETLERDPDMLLKGRAIGERP
ncbi:MAG: MCE family protein [Polyangiaceae bacterium]|nr:MCE family protein [Polyangiaceae bacterium]